MPMADDGPDDDDAAAAPVAVSFLTVRDVDLKGRILAVSTATEMEALPDGTLHRLPYAEFERRVRDCMIMGFALVESVSDERITVLVNAAPLPKELGLCLLLTDEHLTS
ncbi:unnamed protein product [Phytomonas sp. Hart1]|nr:unnamed protein product [Phytomonas sp. Hart1]|eukprot:CCW71630.1 unnamed protein product [Phytomonas sp. isolate Hart1]